MFIRSRALFEAAKNSRISRDVYKLKNAAASDYRDVSFIHMSLPEKFFGHVMEGKLVNESAFQSSGTMFSIKARKY